MSHVFRSPIQLHQKIHERALGISNAYKKMEAELIDVLEQVETHKVYVHYGHASLFQYGVKELALSESIIYNLITVMRKTKEIPQLKAELRNGKITLGNAKRIASVLTQENQNEWLKKAAGLSQRQLEKEIIKIRPLSAVSERTSYITAQRVKLELGLFENDMMNLRRVQDLLSQSRSKHASLEESLIEVTGFYLKHHDPLLKAKRVLVKNESNQQVSRPVPSPSSQESPSAQSFTPKRELIPASILHQVNLRDQRQCTYICNKGHSKTNLENDDKTITERCSQRRWIEIHHRIPVSHGGKNTVDNLITLCSTHHQWTHANASNLASIKAQI